MIMNNKQRCQLPVPVIESFPAEMLEEAFVATESVNATEKCFKRSIHKMYPYLFLTKCLFENMC